MHSDQGGHRDIEGLTHVSPSQHLHFFVERLGITSRYINPLHGKYVFLCIVSKYGNIIIVLESSRSVLRKMYLHLYVENTKTRNKMHQRRLLYLLVKSLLSLPCKGLRIGLHWEQGVWRGCLISHHMNVVIFFGGVG
jgi:hypothetical protein